jgi:hypothetical protein
MAIWKIKAPFTPEQVKNLNDNQKKGHFHPFTCGSAKRCVEKIKVQYTQPGVIKQGEDEFEVSTTLVATEAGWVCPNCDYTQDWAWGFMGEPLITQQQHEHNQKDPKGF